MQDIEFTVEEGTLYILQTRTGKRTGTAALRIATEMVEAGLVEKRHAVGRMVEPGHLDQLLHPQFEDPEGYADDVLGTGLPASPGAAVGRVVFTADDAEAKRDAGEPTILVRIETSPEDVGGMDAAEGILTSRGGMTSHAAVVARGWGKPCVAGCGDIVINYEAKSFTNGRVTIHEGDWISINGSTGEVIEGKQPLEEPGMSDNFATFMGWADEFRTMQVRTNADTPEDAARAVEFGAEGIGLCRTEHMFFEGDRIQSVRRLILADSDAEREAALKTLEESRRQREEAEAAEREREEKRKAELAKAEAEAKARLAEMLVVGAPIVTADEMPLGMVETIEQEGEIIVVKLEDEELISLPRTLMWVDEEGTIMARAKYDQIMAAAQGG